MSEYVREARLSLHVDTNKQTVRRDFASVADLLAALRDLAGEGLDPFDVQDVADLLDRFREAAQALVTPGFDDAAPAEVREEYEAARDAILNAFGAAQGAEDA